MALEVLRSLKVFHARRYQDLIAATAPVFDRVDLAAVFHRPRRAVLKAQRTLCMPFYLVYILPCVLWAQ